MNLLKKIYYFPQKLFYLKYQPDNLNHTKIINYLLPSLFL